jgi:opacity protein-like surface antigen
MRLLVLFCGIVFGIAAQPFSFGFRAGVPATSFVQATNSGSFPYTSITNRYVIGPAAEVRLPLGFAIEFDALYRHYSFLSPGFRTPPPVIQLINGYENVHTGAWELPLLAKYRFPSRKLVRPYVDGGPAWDVLQGLTATVCSINCGNTATPLSLRHGTVTGFAAGAGVSLRARFLAVSPEIRYTRWGTEHFVSPTGNLASNLNQWEFLLGVSF